MTPFESLRFQRITRKILLCTLIFTAHNARASESIKTELLSDFEFDSEVAAVKAMKQHCLVESSRHNAEHVGAILKTSDGRFLVTHGRADPEQESVSFSIQRIPSSKLVALWHTHGAPGRKTQRFSLEDGETVRKTGLPFYLIEPRGQITVLEIADRGISDTQINPGDPGRRKLFRIPDGLALYRIL